MTTINGLAPFGSTSAVYCYIMTVRRILDLLYTRGQSLRTQRIDDRYNGTTPLHCIRAAHFDLF